MTLTTKLLTGSILLFTIVASAQIDAFNYKRNIEGITDEWHKISIPNTVFSKVNSDLSDFRIYGVTSANDTLEAPYMMRVLSEKTERKTITFDIINKTYTANGYYFTFRLNNTAAIINQIELKFNEQNFDWKIELQGSQNQQEWFSILDDYRILSIKNEATNFKFTRLNFPEANYTYFRILVKHNVQPQLQSVKLYEDVLTKGRDINYRIKTINTKDNKTVKATEIDLVLEQTVPINSLKINIKDTFDYYRPFKIQYRSDSIHTEKGWRYTYKILASGTLNSLEANDFKFSRIIAKHLKLTIYNNDNQALSVDGISVKGFEHQLIARFSESANYFLTYGNVLVRQPNYDINKFQTNIPKNLKAVTLNNEIVIPKKEVIKVSPLFENSYWLWGIMGIVILVLGGFTLKMLKKS